MKIIGAVFALSISQNSLGLSGSMAKAEKLNSDVNMISTIKRLYIIFGILVFVINWLFPGLIKRVASFE